MITYLDSHEFKDIKLTSDKSSRAGASGRKLDEFASYGMIWVDVETNPSSGLLIFFDYIDSFVFSE